MKNESYTVASKIHILGIVCHSTNGKNTKFLLLFMVEAAINSNKYTETECQSTCLFACTISFVVTSCVGSRDLHLVV